MKDCIERPLNVIVVHGCITRLSLHIERGNVVQTCDVQTFGQLATIEGTFKRFGRLPPVGGCFTNVQLSERLSEEALRLNHSQHGVVLEVWVPPRPNQGGPRYKILKHCSMSKLRSVSEPEFVATEDERFMNQSPPPFES